MARYPTAGRVKTRLAAALGDERACALYRAFVLDLEERLRAVSYAVTWAYWPPAAPFAALLPGARCVTQQGRDLGERMAAVVAAEAAAGAPALIVIGADVPHVPLRILAEARDALMAGMDVVLGPALDGGYYLIGLRAPVPALFARIDWGTSVVLAQTRERARSMGLRSHLLPSNFDVDEPADLDRLRALLGRGEVSLPRTAALLGDSTGGDSP
jgi:rSAM/selenodomain-associated transferase 1